MILMYASLAFAQDTTNAGMLKDLIGMYEMVVGIFLPLLVSVFVREQWQKSTKLWVSFCFVLAASAGYIFYTGQFDLANVGATVLKIFGVSVTTYKLFWLPSGVTNSLEFGVGITNKQ